MNPFNEFEAAVRAALDAVADVRVVIDRPLKASGTWFLMVAADDGYAVEVQWNRHRGFGIAAGRELVLGSGVDEIFASADAAAARTVALLNDRAPTAADTAVDLGELRKLCGVLQKDVAARMGITKSGLAQLEKKAAFASMQVDTLRRIVSVLGGELVITASFPRGRKRRIAA